MASFDDAGRQFHFNVEHIRGKSESRRQKLLCRTTPNRAGGRRPQYPESTLCKFRDDQSELVRTINGLEQTTRERSVPGYYSHL